MNTRAETEKYIDKTDWPSGEWCNEPDKVAWIDESTKLPCKILRNGVGALCGYVGLAHDHRYHGFDYDQIRARPDDDGCDYVDVHGGLTYSKMDDESNIWWVGFDCAHYGDTAPRFSSFEDCQYRDIHYVTREVVKLAKQLAEVK